MADVGLAVRSWDADPVALAADPDHPGSEMPRTSLPLVAGTLAGAPTRPPPAPGRPHGRGPARRSRRRSLDPFGPELRDGQVHGRGSCDMKGGLVAVLAALAAVHATIDPGDLAGEAVPRPSRPRRTAGPACWPRSAPASWPTPRSSPEPTRLEIVTIQAGADHLPARRPGTRRACVRPPRGRLGAREARGAPRGVARRRGCPQRGRDRAPRCGPWAPLPHDHRHDPRRRLGQHRAGPRRRRRSLRGSGRPDGRGGRRRAARGDRNSLCRGSVAARAPGDAHRRRAGASHRPRSRPTIACRAASPRRPRPSSAGVPRSSACRTGPTCGS